MIILGLPVHSALGQDVGQLGVVGEVRAARVGELSVIFTEKMTRNGYNQRMSLYSLVVVLSNVSSLWPPAMTLLVVQGCLTGSGVLAWHWVLVKIDTLTEIGNRRKRHLT